MCAEGRRVDFGFARERLPAGAHLCQFYSDEKARNDVLLPFLLCGLQAGERCVCVFDVLEGIGEGVLGEWLREHGIRLGEVVRSGALSVFRAADVYLADGCFAPDRMLTLLRQHYASAVATGCSGARVVVELPGKIAGAVAGRRLIRYENRLSSLLRECPMTVVCQYNVRAFDGAVLADVLRVHPLMLANGAIVHNPFFVSPKEFLSRGK